MEDKILEDGEEIVMTEEMLAANPELEEAGVKVGDAGRPATDEEQAALDAEHGPTTVAPPQDNEHVAEGAEKFPEDESTIAEDAV